jgi:DNA polymerase
MEVPFWVKQELWNKDKDILVEAHNAFFEQAIWKNVCVDRLGWPDIPQEKWICSASMAAMHAIPRALDKAGEALGLNQIKNQDGKRVMMQLVKPRVVLPKPDPTDPSENNLRKTKAYNKILGELEKGKIHESEVEIEEDGTLYRWYTPESDPEKFNQLYDYCLDDVKAEISLSCSLAELPSSERELWLLDQKVNKRGIYCDVESADCAIKILEDYAEILLKEIQVLTDGEISSPSQIQKSLVGLEKNGVLIENLQAATVAGVLEKRKLPEKARRFLEIRQILSRSSTKKLHAMKTTVRS